ncbi:rRNA N-glycosidase [Rhynchospora pubera]|uniref:rRNA N-glycosidase n=1 Tax=Rhynchospora pubera TaxID=906938 RepID=A0AAV8G453_9POAL|nr:rRNA N-glycosidase [Rhynchospora pubera]
MEVFSVKLLKLDKSELEQMYGCILITYYSTYVVFSRREGEPLRISREGHLKIRGPDRAIRPMDLVAIVPHLFRYKGCRDQFEDKDDGILWNGIVGGYYDKLLSEQVQSQFGLIEVNFAVYRHGAEARVDVTLSDCQFLSTLVYGSIIIQNSMLGEEGRSFLFNNESECICIDAHHRDKVAQLPLSRSITVHPIGSVVTVYVKLWQRSIVGTPDQPIADGIFNFTACVSGREVTTFRAGACEVTVGVMWAETKMSDESLERPYI